MMTSIAAGDVGALAIFSPRGWPLACGQKDRRKVPSFGQAKKVTGR
ncbi:hypothetical protein QNI22_29060 [Cytophagaceae bacterium BD1B2-1]|uniref:Uncharacterized protein n=1 Tax=Xanthocytophaga agilis TaxID=3048010 RepID=A0AAE3RAX2_9BACT|nr:hypothetical protein [Xanthocytophaga agilis]